MRRLLVSLGLAAMAANAQTVPLSEIELRGFFDAANDSDRADLLGDLLRANKAFTAYQNYQRESQLRSRLTGRNEKELGAIAQPQGSSGLVSAAGVADLISTAIESGALTQTGTGTATTIRVKPLAVYNLFTGRDQSPCSMYFVLTQSLANVAAAVPDTPPAAGSPTPTAAVAKVLNCNTALDHYFGGLSASVTLDNAKPDPTQAQPTAAVNSSGTTMPVNAPNGSVVSLLTQQRSVASWGVRYELYNQRNARTQGFAKAWNKALDGATLKPKGDAFGLAANQFMKVEDSATDFLDWQKTTEIRVTEARLRGWEALEQVWREQLVAFSLLASIKTNTTAAGYDAARNAFITEQNALLKAELEKPIYSFEYTNLRPLNQPDLSNLKLLISKPFHVQNSQEGMFSFNAGADLYNKIPVGAKVGHLRDVSAALQWDIPFGQIKANVPTTFTVAAYYQYQVENGLITIGTGDLAPNTTIQLPSDAKTLLTPKGGIFIGQAKVTFKMKDGSTKIPVGISWANRTELIKATEIRGHVGLQFDWSSIVGAGK